MLLHRAMCSKDLQTLGGRHMQNVFQVMAKRVQQ
jgi:hypothetical protein